MARRRDDPVVRLRAVLALVAVAPASARAEVSVGASLGAGAQGAATYSALELRLDGQWEHARLGLGVRGVWDNADFRGHEWSTPWRALTIVRDVGAQGRVGDTTLGVAAGALAPARVGTLVDGYRVALDDRWRTGVRAAARSTVLDATVEIDDVLDPALVAGGVSWLMAPPWGMHASIAIDPGERRDATGMTMGPEPGLASAFEAGGFRRFTADRARGDLGVSIVAEPSRGASAVVFASGAIERRGVRLTARGDLRAGTGSVGGLFGPLYRIERLADRPDGAGAGLGAGATFGVHAPAGWLELGARARPELGRLVVIGAGAPMSRRLQAGVWAGVGRDDAAGAAELRAVTPNRLFAALHLARLYRLDVMDPFAVWSLTAWVGAATR